MGCPALKFESFHFVDEGEAIRREFCMTGEAVDISGKTTYTYDPNGNRTGLALPNGVVTTTAFDENGASPQK